MSQCRRENTYFSLPGKQKQPFRSRTVAKQAFPGGKNSHFARGLLPNMLSRSGSWLLPGPSRAGDRQICHMGIPVPCMASPSGPSRGKLSQNCYIWTLPVSNIACSGLRQLYAHFFYGKFKGKRETLKRLEPGGWGGKVLQILETQMQ